MDYVLHQAAIPSVPRSVKDPVDVEPRQHRRVAQRAGRRARRRRQAPRLRRLVVGLRRHADAARSARTCRPSPLSPYALQKLVAEQYCQMFTRLYGFETVTIRYFNVFGPRQDPGSPYSGRHLAVLDRAARRAAADHLRRRRADARLHLRRQRRRRRAARLRGAEGRRAKSINVATGGAHLAERAAARDERDRRHEHPADLQGDARRATSRTRRPTSRRRGRCSGTSRSSASKKACAARSTGAAPTNPPAPPERVQ